MNGGMNGGVVWLTGLSGTGKTAVAELLDRRLRTDGVTPVLLDGDRLRAIVPGKFGYTPEDRRALAWWYARLAAEFAGRGHLVVVATISLFHEVHAWSRANVANYLEVWLRVPVAELRTRPGRAHLYDRGADVVGVDVAPEYPLRPDLVIDNHPPVTARRSATLVWSAVSHWYRKDVA